MRTSDARAAAHYSKRADHLAIGIAGCDSVQPAIGIADEQCAVALERMKFGRIGTTLVVKTVGLVDVECALKDVIFAIFHATSSTWS
jgi:hypothetical protein